MPIRNLTKLTVRLYGDDGEVYETFEPSGDAVEVLTEGDEREVEGVPVDVATITEVKGLPEPEEGTFYIVPQPVAWASNRKDLVVPDTGPDAQRNDDGTVHAVRRLFTVVGEV